jgi:hypothetical protein
MGCARSVVGLSCLFFCARVWLAVCAHQKAKSKKEEAVRLRTSAVDLSSTTPALALALCFLFGAPGSWMPSSPLALALTILLFFEL